MALLKEAVYKVCESCGHGTGETLSEAVIGCDQCGQEKSSEFLSFRIFHNRPSPDDVAEYMVCSWACVWKKLDEKVDNTDFAFIDLPSINSQDSLDKFLLMGD